MRRRLFPNFCLHCRQPAQHRLCEGCLATIQLLDTEERCPQCFSHKCETCRTQPPPGRLAATLPAGGAPTTLRNELGWGYTRLGPPLAGFMAHQLEALHWPTPDILIPMPILWPYRLINDYQCPLLLAQSLSKLLSRPYLRAIKRRLDHPATPNFKLTHPTPLRDQTLLLLTDTYDKSLLLAALHTLQQALPRKIFALALTKTSEN